MDSRFERSMPRSGKQALFDESKKLGIGFNPGYAELAKEGGVLHRYTTILVDKDGETVPMCLT